MPLAGSGGPLGDALASAVGAPPAVSSFFTKVGAAIAEWAPANIKVKPGTMAASGGAVAGTGSFERAGEADELGNLIAAKLGIEPAVPPASDSGRQKWRDFAAAFLDHLESYGIANGTGLSSGSPCAGVGTISFSLAVFAPPLSQSLGVTEPVSAAALEAFGAMLLSFIQTNGQILPVSLAGLPLTAPTDGPVTGTGTIG